MHRSRDRSGRWDRRQERGIETAQQRVQIERRYNELANETLPAPVDAYPGRTDRRDSFARIRYCSPRTLSGVPLFVVVPTYCGGHPDTATGVALSFVPPLPSWPTSFLPQQYATPVVVMPHV